MQRITRLLSGTPGRPRWRWPAALLTLAVIGTIGVSQVGLARLPNIHIESSTDGTLRPGDKREITATGFDVDRHYVARVDASGRLIEVYEENGLPKPIDAKARNWIAEMSRLSVPPPPPPPPPAPPAPPPLPPPPPELANEPSFKEILRLVAADAEVVRRVGSPVTLVDREIDGNLRHDGSDGSADLTFVLAGPRGRAEIEVDAERTDGRWSIVQIDVAGD